MNALNAMLDRILADELAEARGATSAIGYLGVDIPPDLLLAAGQASCHLPWRTGRSTPFADRWLEDSFAPWAHSMLEDWADGRFDFFDSVIFSRGDDNSQRLYYYICELRRRRRIGGPVPLIFDIAKIDRQTSARRTIFAVRQLADQLRIGDEQLRAGIVAANRRRTLFKSILARRAGAGSLFERIARASLFANLDDGLAKLEVGPHDAAPRVLLAGSAPPDGRLHLAVEAAEWTVSGESHDRSLNRLGSPIEGNVDEAAAAIGLHAHELQIGPRSFVDRAAMTVNAARQARADAVILWLIAEDEGLTWSVPAQRAALAAAEIPVLIATRRRWDTNDGIAEEITEFLTEISA